MTNKTIKSYEFINGTAKKIYVDRSFQRKTCWNNATCNDFLLSLNHGRAPYPIVVADIASGLTRSTLELDTIGNDKFQTAKAHGKSYISLDGQNRAEALRRMFANELAISGRFLDADGRLNTVENKFYRQLPLRLQDALRDIEVILCVMKDCLYDELHDIFVKINSGDALNPQEKRNAINTPISSFVRDLSEEGVIAEMWPSMSGLENGVKISRSLDSEYTIKAYMATLMHGEEDLHKSKLDRFYSQGRNKSYKDVREYAISNQKRFRNILTELAIFLDNRKIKAKSVPQKIWWLSLYTIEWFHDNNNVCVNYADLYHIICDIDNSLSNQSTIDFGEDVKAWEAKGKIADDEPLKAHYYQHSSSAPQTFRERSTRKKMFFPALLKDARFKKLMERSEAAAA